ncbi:hypothetical protein GCM10010282_23140 [Streptomyces roseolus]|nr:hypothetical protein GCM10010282_23140 [Streptomyces roseolus]
MRGGGESVTEGTTEARFRLRRADAGAPPVLDLPLAVPPGTTATPKVPKSCGPETGPYGWRARVESTSGASARTARPSSRRSARPPRPGGRRPGRGQSLVRGRLPRPAAPFGDYDGEGRSDTPAVDAAGRLSRSAGQEGGGFAARATADARDRTGARAARAG